METTLKITKEGDVLFLYQDESPLMELGEAELRRASNVRWIKADQCWRIFVNTFKEEGPEQMVPLRFDRRSDAIKCEIRMLSLMLEKGDVDVEKIFKMEVANEV